VRVVTFACKCSCLRVCEKATSLCVCVCVCVCAGVVLKCFVTKSNHEGGSTLLAL